MNKEQIIPLLQSVKREGVKELIDWLEDSDFFSAPASKAHHLSQEGGLAEHSWNVYNVFRSKVKQYNLCLSEESIILCALLHDLCKVNFYKRVNHVYKYCDQFPIGHGEKSVMLVQRFVKLTEEECCIIRWHQGNFDLSPYGKPAYYKALEKYPACLALHTADYEATTFLEGK